MDGPIAQYNEVRPDGWRHFDLYTDRMLMKVKSARGNAEHTISGVAGTTSLSRSRSDKRLESGRRVAQARRLLTERTSDREGHAHFLRFPCYRRRLLD